MHTFVTDDGQKIYVNAGNCNFEVGFFVDEISAALFECSMCHLPAFDPVRASCFHLYCRECLLNLQQKTQNCWLQMIIPTKCSKKTGAMRELTAIEDHLYQHLMVACPTCNVLISIIQNFINDQLHLLAYFRELFNTAKTHHIIRTAKSLNGY